MSFSGLVILRVLHITSTCSCDTAAIRIILIRVPTRIILDVSILQYSETPKILCNFIYHILYLVLYY